MCINCKPMIPSEMFEENDIQRSIRQSEEVHNNIMNDYKAFYDIIYKRLEEELNKCREELEDEF